MTTATTSNSGGCREDVGSWRRNRSRRRDRQRLGAKQPNEGEDSGGEAIIDAEFSDIISEIEKADLESKTKARKEEEEVEDPDDPDAREKKEATREVVRKVVKKKNMKKEKAARAPAPAPAPFAFAGSGFASLEDAVASGQFVDMSDGRNSCLKRVEEPGLESDGNPAKGSKVNY